MRGRLDVCVLAIALVASACSSHARPPPGSEPATPAVSADVLPNTNPEGKAYPSNVGVTPRRGDQAGKAIPNLLFAGFPNSITTSGLQTISLANFFDPTGKTYKVIHLSAAAVWCGDCLFETDEAVRLATDLAAKGVVFVQVLVEGAATGQAATTNDLEMWIQSHKTSFTTLLDPNLKKLGILTDGQEYPWNANIDARTMEILSAGVGALPDIAKDVTDWVEWVNAHPVTP